MKLYLWDEEIIIEADLGSDNLEQEDIDQGYTGYINYYTYDISDLPYVAEGDGGMVLICDETIDEILDDDWEPAINLILDMAGYKDSEWVRLN